MTHGTAGRPRTSSRATIEDAANELFIENGYAGTTIDQITQRAGVSRATFFNYFGSKADLLWLAVDVAIEELGAACATPDADTPRPLRDAILATASGFDALKLPLALTQQHVIGSDQEVRDSGLVRVAALTHVFAAARGGSGLAARAGASVLAAAVTAAWLEWARAGIGRDPLTSYLEAALDLVARGIDA
jgi:AcrR family transcriptional regulator